MASYSLESLTVECDVQQQQQQQEEGEEESFLSFCAFTLDLVAKDGRGGQQGEDACSVQT